MDSGITGSDDTVGDEMSSDDSSGPETVSEELTRMSSEKLRELLPSLTDAQRSEYEQCRQQVEARYKDLHRYFSNRAKICIDKSKGPELKDNLQREGLRYASKK